MEKIEIPISEEHHVINDDLSPLFRLLSKHDALKILYHAETGIENSTHAIEELDLTPKKYYARLRALIDTGLVKKIDGVHIQTPLGRLVHDYFIPAMSKACAVKEYLTILELLEDTSVENKIKNILEGEFNILTFAESNKLKMIDDYESGVVELIDHIDDAKDRILLASNHVDVRVIEATVRSVNRGVSFRLIMGKERVESKLQNLKLMLSTRFANAMIEFMSIPDNIGDLTRVADISYSFCVIDDSHSIYGLEKPSGNGFLSAFFIDDRRTTKILADSFNYLWKNGESNKMFNFLESLKNS